MIQIIEYDDWIEIFIDNVLRYENHSISPLKLLDLLKIKYEYKYMDDAD